MDQKRFFKKYEKQRLCRLFDISRETLNKLLNKHYLKELEAVGYKKTQKYLTPKQYAVFIELYGEP